MSRVELVSGKEQRHAKARLVRGGEPKRPVKTVANKKKSAEQNVGKDQRDQLEQKASGASGGVLNQYALDLQAHIEKNQYYPRRALVLEQEGELVVRLQIRADGVFNSIELVKKSTHTILNQAAVNLMGQLGSFRPLPKGYGENAVFLVPIDYQMSEGGL